jgi:hypothetical protein
LRLLVGQPTYFTVARTGSLSSELFLATIKEVMAPLEVGLEIALIKEVGKWETCGKLYLRIFEI